MHNYALFIGRFQPFHNGHLTSIRYGLSVSERIIIAIGGYQLASSPFDPWSALDRKKMILKSLTPEERKKVQFILLRDRLYDEELWKENLTTEIHFLTKKNSKIVIIGHIKDQTSYYLNIFPQWNFIETGNFDNINGTDIRRLFFQNKTITTRDVPQIVLDFLLKFKMTNSFKSLQNQFNKYNLQDKFNADGLLSSLNLKDSILLRVGSYILLKKSKLPYEKLSYVLPELKDVKIKRSTSQQAQKTEHHFYTSKYDGENKDGRTVHYYKFPHQFIFSLKRLNKLKYAWMLMDDLFLNEPKMRADTYQIIHSLV